MKIFFYQATTAFPSSKSQEWIGGENSKVFFSHGMEFDKATITPSLPLNLKGSERVYLIPEGWKAQFWDLLNEKYGNRIEAPVEHPLSPSPESKPSKEEIGSGWTTELATFYEQSVIVVGILTVKPKEEIPPPPPPPKETCRMQFKSMIQGLSAINDPMRLGIIALLLGLPVSVMFAKHLSVERHGNRIEQVKEALADNNQERIEKLREEWQQKGIKDRDNPALIVSKEIEKANEATQDSQKSEPPSSANSTPLPPPPKCYIVQSGDNTIEQIAGYFYNPVTKEITGKIISASIHQENNDDKQIYSLKKDGTWGTSEYLANGKMKANWQLVIPNPTTQDPVNLQKLKDCYSSPSTLPPPP